MIDQARLDELKAEVGEDGFREVLEIFCEEVEEVLTKLEAGGPALADDLHFLKGSALNVGLSGVSDLCREEEMRLKSNSKHTPDIPAIRACYAASKPLLGF